MSDADDGTLAARLRAALEIGTRVRERADAGDWDSAAESAAVLRRILCEEIGAEALAGCGAAERAMLRELLAGTRCLVGRAEQRREELVGDRISLARNRGAIVRYASASR